MSKVSGIERTSQQDEERARALDGHFKLLEIRLRACT